MSRTDKNLLLMLVIIKKGKERSEPNDFLLHTFRSLIILLINTRGIVYYDIFDVTRSIINILIIIRRVISLEPPLATELL